MKMPFSKEQQTSIRSGVVIVAFGILFAAFIFNFQVVWGFVEKLCQIASPFFAGFAIAFLLGPVQRWIEKPMLRTIFKKKDRPGLRRFLSTLFSVLLLLALVFVFLSIMVPQLVTSIESIAVYVSSFLHTNRARLNDILLKFDFLSLNGDELVVAWENIVTSQLRNITAVLDNLVVISKSIVNFLYEALVSLITCFYILLDKDRIAAQIKKIGYSIMKREPFENLISWTRKANHIFAGFITGKIIDSGIIGALCYIGMSIFRMEYPLLISIVIGVTNIIPFFGPFIGWIPCTLILLIVNPMSAIWFSLWILFLQQLDGNVIGPHILGDYVGVSALSIMVAIVIGSGLFGFTGMLLSVPLYALGYAFLRTVITARLRKRGLPVDTKDYIGAPESLPKQEDAA